MISKSGWNFQEERLFKKIDQCCIKLEFQNVHVLLEPIFDILELTKVEDIVEEVVEKVEEEIEYVDNVVKEVVDKVEVADKVEGLVEDLVEDMESALNEAKK